MLRTSFCFLVLSTFALCVEEDTNLDLRFPLDPLFNSPENWQITPDTFEKQFTNGRVKGFRWLTTDRTRALIARQLYADHELELFLGEDEIPIEEVLADFEDNKLRIISVSVYNRADSARINQITFDKRFKALGQFLGKSVSGKPQKRKANPQQGLLTEGFIWRAQKGLALLEHNEGARDGEALEFLRMRLAHPKSRSTLAKAIGNSRGGAAVKISSLARHVTKDQKGNVFIDALPMIDQGNKGYCVVASVQRLFEYYGVGVDMHQLAQIAGSDPNQGTNTLTMAQQLDSIDYRFKTRLEILAMGEGRGPLKDVKKERGQYYYGRDVPQRKFYKEIRSAIDQGIPLLWSLQVGRFEETPNLLPQTSGGHMRTIIGYNDKTEQLIFSDSWGAGHEFKTMDMSDAYRATYGLFLLKPTTR